MADGERGLDLAGVAQLLGVSRQRAWWWSKAGILPVPADSPAWTEREIYQWALQTRPRWAAARMPVPWWPAAGTPSPFAGAQEFPGVVALRWQTEVGSISVLWPLDDRYGPRRMREVEASLMGQGEQAIIEVSTSVFHGPELQALLPGLDGRRYSLSWAELSQAVGGPVPYWPIGLRQRVLLTEWCPGAAPVPMMAVHDIVDTTPLLRMASTLPPDDPSHQVLMTLAQLYHHQAAVGATSIVKSLQEPSFDFDPTTQIVIAAEPIEVPKASFDDIDPARRRAGWLAILPRTDLLAEQCLTSISDWDGGQDLPFSKTATIRPTGSRWAEEWAARLTACPRTAAHGRLDSARQGTALTDPLTDAPAVRQPDGTIQLAIPQRLPAHTPLAEVILDKPIWVRTEDGTVYPAPNDPYWGISWGYQGSGPGTLALLVDALLDDITAKPPASNSGSPKLEALFEREHPNGTVLTRAQLEATRRGDPTPAPPDED